MNAQREVVNVVVMPCLRAIETDIANMLYDTCELIVDQKKQQISKNLNSN
jgi:hypothetical protein